MDSPTLLLKLKAIILPPGRAIRDDLSGKARSHRVVLCNLRGAFLAGLSYALDVETLILQEGDEPVPIDYRDFVSVYKHPHDVDAFINELAPKVMDRLQYSETQKDPVLKGFLTNLELGAPAAENEMSNLGNYYFATDEFQRALEGSVRLAVGRKGSGKTALFFQEPVIYLKLIYTITIRLLKIDIFFCMRVLVF